MAEPVLRCEGLRYRYPGASADSLRGIDLVVASGELVVLCGLSGSGKTTLMRAACGLIPHFHGGEVSGELRVGGLDVRDHGPAELARVVGLVAQDPESQIVSTTVRAEVELPLELRGVPPDERARAVEEVSLALAIPHLLDRTTDTLSGGESQRGALAAALASGPSLVLLDEPTSQLDPVAGDELISLLRRLNEDWGVSVMLGEHRLERCLGAADRVVAVADGAVGFDGPPRAFLEWALAESPELVTPAARLFAQAGLPVPAGVREARGLLRERGLAASKTETGPRGREAAPGARTRRRRRRNARSRRGRREAGSRAADAITVEGAWVELGDGDERVDVLRAVDLTVSRGERVALMGRNGAGKTTLLRVIAEALEVRRGSVAAQAGVAMLPQRPGDMLVHERVGDELPGPAGLAALSLLGLAGALDSDPRDLSGGERQRLALAVALAGRGAGEGEPPGAVLLDEPTRGMDRARKSELARLVRRLSESGAAVIVATHDVEFAAAFADRVVLMGGGEIVADGPAVRLLAGGWYFSTEVARVLDGAAVTPEEGAEVLKRRGRGPEARPPAPRGTMEPVREAHP